MPAVYAALVHYPVTDREGEEVATSVTNIDVHDIARSCHTYGLKGYFITSPMSAQHAIVERILEHWAHGAGGRRIPERRQALAHTKICRNVEEAISEITSREGSPPRLWATSARGFADRPLLGYPEARSTLEKQKGPFLLLFGTGHGLGPSLRSQVEACLAPIEGAGVYNHLSVRAAVAITLDRLLGAR